MARFRSLLAPVAALALVAGCAPTFEARVARFQSLPAPSGQTFTIQASDTRKAGGLEFATYANIVRQKLVSNGFAEASGPAGASLVVSIDYAVGAPREKIETRPGYGYGGFGGYGGYGGYGGFGGFGGYGRFGGFHGWNSRFYPGYWGYYDDPFGYPEVYSVTQYNSFVDMKITRTADSRSVFEGRAETVSSSNDLTQLVPNLLTAIFTNFPGNSGETVRVRFDPSQPAKPATVMRGR